MNKNIAKIIRINIMCTIKMQDDKIVDGKNNFNNNFKFVDK